MSDTRAALEAEAAALQEAMQRLQARAADEALAAALQDFELFRERQRSYQQAESAHLERLKRLEQLRLGAEQLAQQLLSVVKQVDDEAKPAGVG